ncbi:hypothetical protein KP509_29G058200 [Ceratopteris richardii]|uniref:Uncharacterized protein n=1 Tax=Ceratopteris richardii TaxID=49495 RepID=A0A8T2R920_CERRI|nr:hypothetical protein KP509_29G058200 [Ceratopteris richardii]
MPRNASMHGICHLPDRQWTSVHLTYVSIVSLILLIGRADFGCIPFCDTDQYSGLLVAIVYSCKGSCTAADMNPVDRHRHTVHSSDDANLGRCFQGVRSFLCLGCDACRYELKPHDRSASITRNKKIRYHTFYKWKLRFESTIDLGHRLSGYI